MPFCCFLTTAPDEKWPVKSYREYAGPVPAAVCEYLCRRVVGCAMSGYWFPMDAMDAYGEMWLALERTAARLPVLEKASAATYLRAAVDNLIRRFHAREVAPLRLEYRAAEGCMDAADASSAARAERDAPEGKDAAFSAFAAGCEGFDYATGRVGAACPLTAQGLSEKLAAAPSARERRDRAAAALEEIFALVPDDVERALRAWIEAKGDMLVAAGIAHIGKTRWYALWPTWLRRAREAAAEKFGGVWH